MGLFYTTEVKVYLIQHTWLTLYELIEEKSTAPNPPTIARKGAQRYVVYNCEVERTSMAQKYVSKFSVSLLHVKKFYDTFTRCYPDYFSLLTFCMKYLCTSLFNFGSLAKIYFTYTLSTQKLWSENRYLFTLLKQRPLWKWLSCQSCCIQQKRFAVRIHSSVKYNKMT